MLSLLLPRWRLPDKGAPRRGLPDARGRSSPASPAPTRAATGSGRVKRDKTSPALTAFLPRPHPSTFLFLRSARESVGSGARKWSAVQLRDPEGGRHCTRRCTILLDEPVSKRLESGLRAGRGRQRLPGTGQPQPCGVWSQRPAAADRGRPAGSTGAKALPFE